ncbi:MAG: HAD family phosphatase [Clostridiales bacterium]|nr:HAD family phosphatase [Clostridiales bacterium]
MHHNRYENHDKNVVKVMNCKNGEIRIRGAIFDVDGTLLDSMSIWDDLGARYLRSLQVEPESDLQNILNTMTVEEGAAYMKERYHLETSEEEIGRATLQVVESFYYEEAPLKSGVRELLEDFRQRGIPMVVASSSARDHIEAAFRRLGILEYFERIFTCTEIGVGKTRPDIFLTAAEFLKAKPEEVYVFEDAIHAVETAKNAGFPVVAVYDEASKMEWSQICEMADVAVVDLGEFCVDKL